MRFPNVLLEDHGSRGRWRREWDCRLRRRSGARYVQARPHRTRWVFADPHTALNDKGPQAGAFVV